MITLFYQLRGEYNADLFIIVLLFYRFSIRRPNMAATMSSLKMTTPRRSVRAWLLQEH